MSEQRDHINKTIRKCFKDIDPEDVRNTLLRQIGELEELLSNWDNFEDKKQVLVTTMFQAEALASGHKIDLTAFFEDLPVDDEDKKEQREMFNEWFTSLMFKTDACLERDVLRHRKEALFAEWLIMRPWWSKSDIEKSKKEAKRLSAVLSPDKN